MSGIYSPPGASPTATGTLIGADADRAPVAVDELSDLIIRLRQIQLHIKSLTSAADEIKAAIQDAMGDYEVGTVHGRPTVYWTQHTRHALDQKALRDNEPYLFNAYLKASPYRRFVLVEERDDD